MDALHVRSIPAILLCVNVICTTDTHEDLLVFQLLLILRFR